MSAPDTPTPIAPQSATTAQPPPPADWRQDGAALTAPQLLLVFAALANPHRLRIIAALHSVGRVWVSQLARQIGISRPLLHLHLQKLAEAGLVRMQAELGPDGRALNQITLSDFALRLDPARLAAAGATLADDPPPQAAGPSPQPASAKPEDRDA